MKYKFLIPITLSIIIGLFLGKIFFDGYSSTSLTVFDEKDKIYMLQTGVYSSRESLEKNNENYKKYLILKENNNYHLYVGITKSKSNAKKIKEFYEKNGNSIYIKEKIINNKSFTSLLNEYDKIIEIASDNDIPEIEKIVISNYKEMVVENEN